MTFTPRHALSALALSLIAATAQAQSPFALSYLGQQIVPSGTPYAGTTVGGLSGIDYDAAHQRYFSISDDRSGINPARYYTLNLDLNQFKRSATPGMAGVSFTSVTTLQTPAGAAFGLNTVDPEGVRYNASTGTLYWSNEGQRAAAGFQNPTVREMKLDGSHVRDFAVPSLFNPVGSNSGLSAGDRGIYNNLAFESLTLSTDGKTLYTATENALAQDSLPATLGNGSTARILGFDVATGAAGAQFPTRCHPWPCHPSRLAVLPPTA